MNEMIEMAIYLTQINGGEIEDHLEEAKRICEIPPDVTKLLGVALSAYLKRIKAVPRNFRRYVVSDYSTKYKVDRAVITLNTNTGAITITKGDAIIYGPTDKERAEIAADVVKTEFPISIAATAEAATLKAAELGLSFAADGPGPPIVRCLRCESIAIERKYYFCSDGSTRKTVRRPISPCRSGATIYGETWSRMAIFRCGSPPSPVAPERS